MGLYVGGLKRKINFELESEWACVWVGLYSGFYGVLRFYGVTVNVMNNSNISHHAKLNDWNIDKNKFELGNILLRFE